MISLLHNAFGIRGGYTYTGTMYVEGQVVYKIEQPRENLRCSHCGSAEVHVKTHETRSFRTVSIGDRATWVILPIARVHCQACGKTRQVKVPFANDRVTYTKAFERYVLSLCDVMTIQDVAKHLAISWDTVKGILKKYLKKKFSRPKLKNLKLIAIDEIHVGKGMKYLTVVLDLITGAVVFVGKGRGQDALKAFWRKLNRSSAKIRAVATDMSGGYTAAVRKNLPNAVHVFDRFHVVKLFNEKLSQFRRDLFRELTDDAAKRVLKGVRWLLLKNPENLDDTRNEGKRLQDALDLNQPLAIAYYMKDFLHEFWRQDSKEKAAEHLNDWIQLAQESEIKMLIDFAKTIQNHWDGLLNWYDFQISTGPLEATNNKIQLLNRQAFGYRDAEFFHLKIMAMHLSRYALVG